MSYNQETMSNHPFAPNSSSYGQGNPSSSFGPQENYPVTSQPSSKINNHHSDDGDGKLIGGSAIVPVCSPSLEYLNFIDQLIVHQKVELLEVLLGCETRNKYEIKNSMGQIVLNAIEDTDCCNRNCLGPLRPFDMKILDFQENEVLHLYREFRCQSCCCPCCLQRMEVYALGGNLLGFVVQQWSICKPKLEIQTVDGEVIFHIEGPFCVFSCCNDVDFHVYASNGNTIGKITKQWSGLAREAFTDADHFGVTFPIDLSVNMKALLLGALFLIDFMYFEKPR